LASLFDIRVINRNMGDLDGTDWTAWLRRASRHAGSTTQVLTEIARLRPAVLHICSTGNPAGLLRDLPAFSVARELGARTILHIHGAATRLGSDPTLWPRIQPALRQLDHIAVLNQESMRFLADQGLGPQSVYLPNGVPATEAGLRSMPTGRPLRVLYVGWLMPAKGVLDLLEAASQVPELEVHLLGRFVPQDGESCEATLRTRIEQPDLSGRVILHGEVPRDQVPRFLSEADVFCLPSHGEGFPMALLEAMMAGLPCIVSAVGAMPDVIVDDQTGWVVPRQDTPALVHALRRYVLDPASALAHGQQARETALAQYTLPAVHARLRAVWSDPA
jgi:glycosyltransferase involved in cell wall biosynthesis